MKDDVHVVPIGDLKDHDESRICWCAPKILVANKSRGTNLVVHNALDASELVEQHGVN